MSVCIISIFCVWATKCDELYSKCNVCTVIYMMIFNKLHSSWQDMCILSSRSNLNVTSNYLHNFHIRGFQLDDCVFQRSQLCKCYCCCWKDISNLYYYLNWYVYFGCCYIQHHAQTIHPTENFISMNLLQMSCVITWAWSFLTSEVVEAVRGQKHHISTHTLAL